VTHRSVLLAAVGVGLLVGASAPAFADRDGWHGGWHGGWHEHYVRGPEWGYRYARPYYWGPRVYYAPPPVYYGYGYGYPAPGLTVTIP